jgi:hypothetical protein
MAFIKLQFKPGLNRDQTNYTNEGGWFACDKIRFRSGYPQKLGGWVAATSQTFLGVCRQLFGWITSFSDNLLALGTSKKVYIEVGAQYYDITPYKEVTAAGDVTFDATTGSSSITVFDNAANPVVGNYVTFSGAVSLGGLITAAVLNQNYEIATVVDQDEYTIIAKAPDTGLPVTANASDTGDGGASVVGSYEIDVGFDLTTYGYGWGTSTWGTVPWGLGSGSPIFIQQRDWFFDQLDNDLIMNYRNGQLFIWQRGAGGISSELATRAIYIADLLGAADVPGEVMQCLISQNDRHLLAFGCIPYGSTSTADFDPMLIRWSSQDAPEFWTPGQVIVPSTGTLSSAGFRRVSRGSKIVRALPTRQAILVFTDTHLYSFQFVGTTDVFDLQEYADNISIMSPRSVISASAVTYWMGSDKFYVFNGQVQTLPCTLRNQVFQNLNYDQSDQIICGTVEAFHEIWWFYPSAQSDFNDSYVVYNYLEQVWYYGTIDRTAWLDAAQREFPQAVGVDNILYNHESGVDADGIPLESFIQSSDFDLGDGDEFMLSRRVIPDIDFSGSTSSTPEVDFMIRPRNFPGSAYQDDAFDSQAVVQSSVNNFTDQVFIRARARQMALKIQSTGLGVTWQLGSPRLDARKDGRR